MNHSIETTLPNQNSEETPKYDTKMGLKCAKDIVEAIMNFSPKDQKIDAIKWLRNKTPEIIEDYEVSINIGIHNKYKKEIENLKIKVQELNRTNSTQREIIDLMLDQI